MDPRPCEYKEDGHRTCGKYCAPDRRFCPRHVLLNELDEKRETEKAAKKAAEKKRKK